MNNRGLNNLFIFGAGAIAGSMATWFAVKEYYKRIADEEIESVKETFSRLDTEDDADISDVEECAPEEIEVVTSATAKKPNLMEYAAIIKEQGYVNYASTPAPTTTTKKEEEKSVARPYIINPVYFGEEYETVSLNYYADGVLTDDMDEPIDDVASVVGTDFMTHFGEYEKDSVFVRNDERKIDYEILRDYGNYSGVAVEE